MRNQICGNCGEKYQEIIEKQHDLQNHILWDCENKYP